MAKRRNLKDTLRRERSAKSEQEPVLAPKVELPKTTKDIQQIAQQADTIHQADTKSTTSTPSSPTPLPPKKVERKTPKKATPALLENEPKERVTVWLPKHLLKSLKIHLATEEKKITDYFTELVKKDLKIK